MFHPSFWKNTDYKITSYSQKLKQDLKTFCEAVLIEKGKPASALMEFNLLINFIEKKILNQGGEFFLFYINGKIAGVSGFYPTPVDPKTFVCAVRTYSLVDFRYYGIHSNFLLPHELIICRSRGAQQCLLVFDYYNEKLFNQLSILTDHLKKQSQLNFEIKKIDKPIQFKNATQYALLIQFEKNSVFNQNIDYSIDPKLTSP